MPNTFTTTTATSSAFNASNWLKARLPDGQTFTRNGVTVTLDDAIAAALELYEGKAEPHLWAAWDLWDQIASGGGEETFESESLDGWSYRSGSKSTAADRAAHYKALAEASEMEAVTGGTTGSFQMVTGTYGRSCSATDENSR